MSTKQPASGNAAIGAALAAPETAQSATARRAAETQLRALVATYAAAQSRLVGTARRWLRKRLPTAHEIVYEYRDCFVISYSPNTHGYDGVLALRASADGVALYFNRGKNLPDPGKLLKGSGQQTRSIRLEGAATLARPQVAALVDEALARNLVPYPRAGLGSVLIRSTAANKRGPTPPKESP
jgi:hypothetical protein